MAFSPFAQQPTTTPTPSTPATNATPVFGNPLTAARNIGAGIANIGGSVINTISGNPLANDTARAYQYTAPATITPKFANPAPSEFGSALPKPAATPATSTTGAAPLTPNTASPEQQAATYRTVTLPSGAAVSVDGSGNIVTPSFNIDTSNIPSDALNPGATTSFSDLANKRNQYAQYVQQLAQASGYSPDYLNAYQQSQTLAAQEAQLKGNLAAGLAPGATEGFADGFTNRALMGAEAQKAFADISLQAQSLARQGDIAGAKALVDAYAPQSISPGSSLVSPVTGDQLYSGLGGYQAVQGIQTVNNLAQEFPDAGIQPTDSLATATQKASQAPSFQSRNLVQVTLPGGGISFVNRNQLQTNSDGSYSLVSSADAATQKAAEATIADLTKQRADVAAAITTADSTFPLVLQAAKEAGVNNNAPLVNELQRKILNPTSQSAALAQLNTLIPSIQTEYSRIIARGGSVDDKTRNAATAIVNGNYSLAQLQAVYNTVQKEGQNVLKGYDYQITAQQKSLGGGSSANPFSASNFFGS